jgi:glycosyltransferase involved in cell wall biosynthesis
MRRCDLMVRPTTSDGDSNAIREALHLNLPVVASDCVQRPDGVITYPMQEDHALAATVTRVLNDLEGERQKLHLLPRPDYAQPIVKLIHELLERES